MDIFRYFREDYNGHSKSNAYLLALISYYIYRGNPPGSGAFEARFKSLFQNLSSSNQFHITIFADDAEEVAILSNSRLVLVGWRGTDKLIQDPSNWVSTPNKLTGNLPAIMLDVPNSWGSGVKIHQGFYNALNTVYASVKDEVKSRMNAGGRKLFVTGHSRGGALATLCAYRLHKVDGANVSGVYLFGSPRIGNVNFRTRYNEVLGNKTFRWVRNADFANMLPDYGTDAPIGWAKYHHVGKLNFIDQNGQIIMNHGDPDYEPLLPPSGNDHDMRNYCIFMYNRLSTDSRTSPTNPLYLVRGDVLATGLPV